MIAFLLLVAGLTLVCYLLQRRRPRRTHDAYAGSDGSVDSSGYSGSSELFSGSSGTFGGDGASGDWGASESSGGSDGGGGD